MVCETLPIFVILLNFGCVKAHFFAWHAFFLMCDMECVTWRKYTKPIGDLREHEDRDGDCTRREMYLLWVSFISLFYKSRDVIGLFYRSL